MARNIVALIIASVCAPFLVMVFLLAMAFLRVPPKTDLAHLLSILKLVGVGGGIGLLLYGLPVFVLSGAATFVLRHFRWHASWQAVGSGAFLGFGCLAFLFFNHSAEFWDASVSGALSGAVCGWIYWRIATSGGTKSAPHSRA